MRSQARIGQVRIVTFHTRTSLTHWNPRQPDSLARLVRVWGPKVLIRLNTVPVDFHVWYPRQMNFLYIYGMNNIVTLLTNVRQALKGFSRLVVSDSGPHSRDNTNSVWLKKDRSEHLIANGRYSYSLPKGVYFNQLQKEIPKCTICLPHYIIIVQVVGKQLLLIAKKLLFSSSSHSKYWGCSSPDM